MANNEPNIIPTVPEFKLPESNSLVFALVQEYNGIEVYQNQFNSKAIQSKTNVVDCLTQEYHWEDNPITQFRSNYDNIVAKATDENGSEVVLNVELKVENLNQTMKMDSMLVNVDSRFPGKTGIYFTEGQTYDYGTNDPLSTYELFGRLPEWGVVGNYVCSDLFDEWFLIEDIFYDSSIAAEVLIVNKEYLGLGEADKASSLYNRFNYNVYEFVFPLYDKKSLSWCVSLENTDTRDDFIDIKYSSEDIFVDDYDEDEDVLEIIYFNYNNSSDVNYSTGFYGILRLPFISFVENTDNEQSNEKTSNSVIPLSATNYQGKTLSLERVPTMLMRKLTQSFSHKEIFINRIQYTVKSIDPEWVASTNSYNIEIDLYDAEDGFNPLVDRRYCGDRFIYPNISGSLDEELDFEI